MDLFDHTVIYFFVIFGAWQLWSLWTRGVAIPVLMITMTFKN